MYYSPHILQRRIVSASERDEFGRAIADNSSDKWETICRCRCDDNTTQEFKSDNGAVFRPNYHVVCEGTPLVKVGEKVRCISTDGTLRGEGAISIKKATNFYQYTEIWF